MGDDTEFTKLPIEDCCCHKLWKARVHGYTEAAKLFGQADDERAPIFSQYVGIISKMVSDSNAAAQEKGLEAVLLYVQSAQPAGKLVKDVVSTLVAKCIAAPKAKTKEFAVQIVLMYIEIEKQDVVQEELLKGMQQKNPKTVAACISTMTLGLKEFGPKVIDIKPLLKIFPTLLEDRDKGVRDEAKNLIVEIYRWMGDALKPKLSTLKPVQLSELETEFGKAKSGKAVPTRYLRSQQVQQVKVNGAAGDAEEVDGDESVGAGDACEVDPMDLIEAINILTKLPPDFYKNLEAKKWQERKEAVEALEKVLDYPKFEKGDYGDLVRALMKVVTKDSNVVVVGVTVKCIAKLAGGLKKFFQPYAGAVLPQLLEKFKEKKANVVTPLREAVDAVFPATSLEAIQEDVIASLDNKNPSIKAETASFLARCFAKSTPTTLNKKLLKLFTTALLKTLNEPDPGVRDSSADALGTAMKVVGEKVIMPFMTDLDNLKLTKIKECCEKAVVVKVSAPKPAKVEKPEPKPVVKKVLTGGAKKAATAAAVVAPQPAKKSPERDMTQEEVDEKANDVFSEEVIKGFADSSWKVRLESIESFTTTIKIVDPTEISGQLLIKTLNKKPGLKESNVQVLKAKLDALNHIVQTFSMDSNLAELILPDLVEKLGDPKNGPTIGEIFSSLSEALGLNMVGKNVLELAFEQKNPKVQSETLNWLSESIKQFGLTIDVKCVIETIKKGLNATNAAVRTSAVTLCGVLHMYVGPQLLNLLSNEKPAVLSLINAEIEKRGGENAPTPTKGGKKDTADDSSEVDDRPTPPDLSDLIPRVDISNKITEELITELSDKNWKVRCEALTTVSNIINNVKCIKSNLGELPPVLAQRLVDSNGKIAQTALEICKNIATAMGPPCKTHVKTFLRGFLVSLGDNKQWVRQAAQTCISTWGTEAGYKEFFEGEIIPDALKTGSPTMRTEVWNLLSETLPNLSEKSVSKDELLLCLPYLYANLEDRNAEVRKSAQSCVLGMMIHVGYPNMVKQAEKLKPVSKGVIMALLDKTRPDLPSKPEPKSNKAPKKEEAARPDPRSTTKAKIATVKPTVKKKEEEVDLTPLLPINSMKQQRIIDEQRLKTLKWNFTLPRAEFVELLREQMTNAKLNRTLIANMFHADFKYHLKAIDSLNEELGNTDAIISNLDLILKWMTLRFFDTNPSVLLKGLEYLQNVFSLLIDANFTMSECEANSFIPYLVLKIGDPKDAVRDRVKGILKQIADMFTASKLFILIMEGLKSKNARQRTECLDEIGSLIENFGMSVCQPSPSQALKEIAKQISDRDNSVRNAAMNAIVKAYYIEGDKIYKMIGNISDKDSSLLAERIKRAGKNRPITSTSFTKADVSMSKTKLVVEEEYEESSPEPEPPVVVPVIPAVREEPKVEKVYQKLDLIKIDDSFLNSPIQIPERLAGKFPKRETIKPEPTRTGSDIMKVIISDLRSNQLQIAHGALFQWSNVTANTLGFTLDSEQINEMMASVVIQLKFLNSYSYDVYGIKLYECYKLLLMCIDNTFSKKTPVGIAVNSENLSGLIQELLVALVDEKTIKFPSAGITKILQIYVARIIENSNFTNVSCAAVKLLHSVVSCPPSNEKMTDVVTKCLLKVIVIIKKNPLSIEYDLNLDLLLFECHLFFQSFPQHTWKDRPSVLPLKAIKTLLLTLVQIKGKDIFSHLSLVEHPCASELSLYLKKLLKSQPDLNVRGTKLTKEMSDHLSEVFMKIACESTAREGLLQFYNFKKKNPNVDLTPYLAPTSKYFQEYVENGLKEIEREVLGGTNVSSTPPTTSSVENKEDTTINENPNLAQYYLDKLKGFHEKIGYPPPECPDFVPK